MSDNVIVFGATSAMALGAMRRYAAEKARLVLVGRSPEKLDAVRNDLLAFGAASADVVVADEEFNIRAVVSKGKVVA